jgi:deoxycytidine triphosphate deaminase
MADTPEATGLPDFPDNGTEAQRRFELYRSKDPFPGISPALLNSADLLDYIATVGMLSPYNITPRDREDWVKPASCAVACTGDVLRFEFDENRGVTTRHEYELSEERRLELPANSITFLQLGTTFRIPDYIAARFNLAIREIHRGFLVAPAPLIDPGFVGRLFVPLHNLTSNSYSAKFNEPLVWVEFTKLSPNEAWDGETSQPRRAEYVPFPEKKLERRTPAHYLDHANEGKAIASSIPKEIGRAIVAAEKARSQVRRLRNIGIGASDRHRPRSASR